MNPNWVPGRQTLNCHALTHILIVVAYIPLNVYSQSDIQFLLMKMATLLIFSYSEIPQ